MARRRLAALGTLEPPVRDPSSNGTGTDHPSPITGTVTIIIRRP